MSACASCGTELTGSLDLCGHHHTGVYEEGWAVGNRIVCDFLHRGVVPSRLSAADRLVLSVESDGDHSSVVTA